MPPVKIEKVQWSFWAEVEYSRKSSANSFVSFENLLNEKEFLRQESFKNLQKSKPHRLSLSHFIVDWKFVL